MFANNLTSEYDNGVEEFIKFVVEHVDNVNRIKYTVHMMLLS